MFVGDVCIDRIAPPNAVAGQTVGGQAAGLRQPLERTPSVVRILQQLGPFIRAQPRRSHRRVMPRRMSATRTRLLQV